MKYFRRIVMLGFEGAKEQKDILFEEAVKS